MINPSTFQRHELRENLVVSTCVFCRRIVASGNERLLRVAETAHLCPKLQQFENEREGRSARPVRSAG